MKLIFMDTETTGLDAWQHGIVQLAGYIEIDGEVVDEYNFYMKPFPWQKIDSKALEVNGLTVGQIEQFMDPKDAFRQFISMLDKYVNKFDKTDKFVIVGQNVVFDIGFIKAWFKNNDHKYYHSYFDHHYMDSMMMGVLLRFVDGAFAPENLKLKSIAVALGIDSKDENLHDAMYDIKLTREVFYHIIGRIVQK